jgi:E3 ubiquitin-protein transferase RMND5
LKDWTKEDEIPIAFDYSKENQYHSIFICPVTKEIITEDNPAMMLKCGHVISE